MIKVLIVDDEPSHIEGLVRYVQWHNLGFEIPLTALSAQEALAIMQETTIEVLITDVSMPIMTGIELVAQSRLINPQLQTLMISGYNEFEFVQDAINVGAQAYVLKPIKIEEIENKLKAFRASLEKLSTIEAQNNELLEKFSESLDLIKERFLTDLISESIVDVETLNSWKLLLGIPESVQEIRMIVFGYDHFYTSCKEARARVVNSIGFMNAVSVALGDFNDLYVTKTYADEIVILHLNYSPLDKVLIEKQLIFIQNVMMERYGATITIGVSKECRTWFDIPLLYKEVKFMIARSRLIEVGQINYNERLEEFEFQDSRLSEEHIPEILKLTETDNAQKVIQYVNHMFDVFMSLSNKNFSYIQAFGMGLLSELARKQKWTNEISGDMNIHMWQQLIDCSSETQIREVVFEYLNRYMLIKQTEKVHQQHNLIVKIAAFMEDHIHEQVTVKQIADIHHLNASYLSVLFKKEMGKTISEFVQETRMSKAKELLSDPNVKVYEVAEQIGFQTSAYFTYLFKKTFGYTPQEFRDYH